MADLTAIDGKLLESARLGALADVQRHISAGADVNCRGQHGMNPLLWASSCGHLEVVRYLLSHGADVNYTGMREGSPLMLAAYAGQLELMALYLEYRADVNLVLPGAGETALHMAAVKNQTEAAKLLIRAGADLNRRTNVGVSTDMIEDQLYGETPLHFAAAYGDRDMIEAMMTAGADKALTNGKGERPLSYAERAKRPPEIMDMLR